MPTTRVKLALCALAFAALPLAAQRARTEPSLAERIATARDGETIRLAEGDYGQIVFPRRSFVRGLTIEADAARFSGLVLHGVRGVTIRGGTITGPGGRSYGIGINGASGVTIDGITITGAHRGIVVNESSDIVLTGNRLTRLISDGIDVALSRRVRIERNVCRDFSPRPAQYDATGKLLRDGDHPDCIQAWSRPTAPPTADITVIGNDIDGNMQGIFFGNHVRNGVDDGGFDRVVIRGNRVKVSFPNGIYLKDGRQSVVRDNVVETLPGARSPKPPYRPWRSGIRVFGGTGLYCGNTVTDAKPGTDGLQPCPKN